MNVIAQSFVKTVINGGSLTDSLGEGALSAVIDIAGAMGAQRLGSTTLADGSPTKIAAHALLGGLKSMAMGGDFQTGAIAGGATEGLVQYLAKLALPEGYDPASPASAQAQANLVAMTQLVAVLTTVVTGGDPEIAANIAANATQYNYLTHSDLERAANSLNVCAEGDAGCVEKAQQTFMDLSRQREISAINACAADITACKTSSSLAAAAQADQEHLKDLVGGASQQAQVAYGRLVAENFEFQNMLAGITAGQSADAIAQTLQNKWGMSDAQMVGIRESLRMIGTMGVASRVRSAAGAKGIQGGGGKASTVIAPGMDRPFRQVNPEFPPNKSVVDAMDTPQIKNMVGCSGTDCSDIASKLLDASGGKGKIIEVRPSTIGNLNVYENGVAEPGQFYHQVYTDGRYVYDPRLSSSPIPKGDWEQHIKNINPEGVTVLDKPKGLR
jgi:filamentous hemagglutinin